MPDDLILVLAGLGALGVGVGIGVTVATVATRVLRRILRDDDP